MRQLPFGASKGIDESQSENHPAEKFVEKSIRIRDETIEQYVHHLWAFDAYLKRIGLEDLRAVLPLVVSSFLTERGPRLRPGGIQNCCSVMRVFLQYLHRTGVVARDLKPIVEAPPPSRLARFPRSITWDQILKMLEAIDRRTALRRRDYAMLLLLVTYGLRAGEVAALRLDDIEWRQDRLRVPDAGGDRQLNRVLAARLPAPSSGDVVAVS